MAKKKTAKKKTAKKKTTEPAPELAPIAALVAAGSFAEALAAADALPTTKLTRKGVALVREAIGRYQWKFARPIWEAHRAGPFGGSVAALFEMFERWNPSPAQLSMIRWLVTQYDVTVKLFPRAPDWVRLHSNGICADVLSAYYDRGVEFPGIDEGVVIYDEEGIIDVIGESRTRKDAEAFAKATGCRFDPMYREFRRLHSNYCGVISRHWAVRSSDGVRVIGVSW